MRGENTVLKKLRAFLIMMLFGFMACPSSDNPGNGEEPDDGMRQLPDGSRVSGVFTKASELIFVTGNNDGQIRYSWTAADPGTGVTYRLYVIEGEVTDPNVIIADGTMEDTANSPRLIGIFNGTKGRQYSAVVMAQRGASLTDKAYSAVKTAVPRQHFDTEPVFAFTTGVNEGEINFSWTSASPTASSEAQLTYNLYICGESNSAENIVNEKNLYATVPSAWSGTFRGIPGRRYNAVLQTADGSIRVNSPVIQADTKGRESLGENFDVRFGVFADPHIGGIGRGAGNHPIPGFGVYPMPERTAKVLQWYNTQPGIDYVFINGDLIQGTSFGEGNATSQFATLGETLNAHKGRLNVIAAKGNHDGANLNNFRNATGGLEPNAHYVVNGYHFITLVGSNGGESVLAASADWEDTTAQAGGGAIAAARPIGSGTTVGTGTSNGFHFTAGILTWLRNRIEFARDEYEKAGVSGRPIFIFSHWPVRNTYYVSDEWYTRSFGDDPLTGWFKDDSDVVIFGSHIHSPNNDPRSIWQGGFTSVNVPTLHYMDMERGYLGGVLENAAGTGTFRSPKVAELATGQGVIVSVSGTKVTVKNFDFDMNMGRTPLENVVRIPQTWEFDVSKPTEFPYTQAKRDGQRTVPVFDPSAASDAALNNMITIKDRQSTSVEIEFLQARIPGPNPGSEVVHSYRFDFINTATGSVARTARQWSDFMLTPRLQMPTYTQRIGGLTANTEYELRIYAIGSFQAESSQYLTLTFKTL